MWVWLAFALEMIGISESIFLFVYFTVIFTVYVYNTVFNYTYNCLTNCLHHILNEMHYCAWPGFDSTCQVSWTNLSVFGFPVLSSLVWSLSTGGADSDVFLPVMDLHCSLACALCRQVSINDPWLTYITRSSALVWAVVWCLGRCHLPCWHPTWLDGLTWLFQTQVTSSHHVIDWI